MSEESFIDTTDIFGKTPQLTGLENGHGSKVKEPSVQTGKGSKNRRSIERKRSFSGRKHYRSSSHHTKRSKKSKKNKGKKRRRRDCSSSTSLSSSSCSEQNINIEDCVQGDNPIERFKIVSQDTFHKWSLAEELATYANENFEKYIPERDLKEAVLV